MPPAITTTTLDRNDPVRSKAEVLYMAPNGQIQPFESGGLPSNRGRSIPLNFNANSRLN